MSFKSFPPEIIETPKLSVISCDLKNSSTSDLVQRTKRTFSQSEYVGSASRKAQYISGFAANLCIVSAGMMYGWTSPALQELDITPSEKSSLTSILMLGGVFGCLLTTLVIDHIGRKLTIILTTIPYITSWILIYFLKEELYLLYVARFIGGLSVGAAYCVLPMYIGEISDDAIRGTMGSLLDLSLSIGILFEYCIGPYVSFEVLALTSLVVPALNLLCTPVICESPYFYLMKNDWKNALSCLQTLRGRKNVEMELLAINDTMVEELRDRQGIIKLFTKYGNRKALVIMLGLMTAQQFSGVGAIVSYSEEVFVATGGKVDPSISTIGVGVAQLGACILSAAVADKFGRRTLLLYSAIGSALMLAFPTAIFYLKEVCGTDTSEIADFTIASFIVYMVLVNVGLSSQTYVILSEIFSTNIKAVAVCASTLYMLMFEAIVTKIFEMVKSSAVDHEAYYLSFLIFLISCLLSWVFVYFLVPETKGKSLEEIQIGLNKNKPVNLAKLMKAQNELMKAQNRI